MVKKKGGGGFNMCIDYKEHLGKKEEGKYFL